MLESPLNCELDRTAKSRVCRYPRLFVVKPARAALLKPAILLVVSDASALDVKMFNWVLDSDPTCEDVRLVIWDDLSCASWTEESPDSAFGAMAVI